MILFIKTATLLFFVFVYLVIYYEPIISLRVVNICLNTNAIIKYKFFRNFHGFLFLCIAEKKPKLPKVGDLVHVPSLNKTATVMKLDLSKEEIVVLAGNLKLKLKLADVAT